MLSQLRPALVLLALFTVVTGVAYPLSVTGIAQVLFPRQANGSLIEHDGRPIGSELIGQNFDEPRYFWGRPSATRPSAYDATASSGSNLGPTNPALATAVRERIAVLQAAGPHGAGAVPIDLVTTSGSGLDPHISPAAALYQVRRVARARGLPEERVRALVEHQVEERTFGLFGERRVNVLRLNLALDGLAQSGT